MWLILVMKGGEEAAKLAAELAARLLLEEEEGKQGGKKGTKKGKKGRQGEGREHKEEAARKQAPVGEQKDKVSHCSAAYLIWAFDKICMTSSSVAA